MTDPGPASNDDPHSAETSAGDHAAFLRLSQPERRVLGTAGGVLAAAAAIVQVVGTTGGSPAKSIILVTITIVAGGLILVLTTRYAAALKRKVNISYLFAS